MLTPKSSVAAIAARLHEAEDKMQDARHSSDGQALGYAEGDVLRFRRELAKLDPRGAGHKHLDTLSEAERLTALR